MQSIFDIYITCDNKYNSMIWSQKLVSNKLPDIYLLEEITYIYIKNENKFSLSNFFNKESIKEFKTDDSIFIKRKNLEFS